MMTAMDHAGRAETSSLERGTQAVGAFGAPIGFLLAASADPRLNRPGARALLGVVAIVVVATTAASVLGGLPRRTSGRRAVVAYGTVMVVTTLVFAGYLGAETPDATWFGGGAVHGPTGGNEVALTFDDGPN